MNLIFTGNVADDASRHCLLRACGAHQHCGRRWVTAAKILPDYPCTRLTIQATLMHRTTDALAGSDAFHVA